MPSCQSNLCCVSYRFDVDNHVPQTAPCKFVVVNVSGACHWGKKRKILCNIIQENHISSCCIVSFIIFIIFILMWCSVIMAYWVIIVTSCHVQWCQTLVICVITKVNKLKITDQECLLNKYFEILCYWMYLCALSLLCYWLVHGRACVYCRYYCCVLDNTLSLILRRRQESALSSIWIYAAMCATHTNVNVYL